MTTEIKPPVLGDILKSEADINSRVVIPASPEIKIGMPVPYGNGILIALSDCEHGKVLVQPRNCNICLDSIPSEYISENLEALKAYGESVGIKYDGEVVTPKTPLPSPPAD